jgi:hypothetical protein
VFGIASQKKELAEKGAFQIVAKVHIFVKGLKQ